jgi:hypothetical protein
VLHDFSGGGSDGSNPFSNLQIGRAFDAKMMLIFAAIVGSSVSSTALVLCIGRRALFAGAIVMGNADAHTATVSTATLVAAENTDEHRGHLPRHLFLLHQGDNSPN